MYPKAFRASPKATCIQQQKNYHFFNSSWFALLTPQVHVHVILLSNTVHEVYSVCIVPKPFNP